MGEPVAEGANVPIAVNSKLETENVVVVVQHSESEERNI